jgi:hypothetical protein
MMLFDAPLEPVLLVNKNETTASDDAAAAPTNDALPVDSTATSVSTE